MNTISYSLNRRDLTAFKKLTKSNNTPAERTRWAVVVLIALGTGYLALTSGGSGLGGMITRETVLALLPIFVGISVFFSLPSIKARLGLDKRPETPMISFTADDQECLMTANGVETRTPWTSIVNMTVTEEHVFLWLNRTSAIIIPLRAFPDAAAAQSFVELAEEKHVASAA